MKARFLALAALVLGLASCQTEPEGLNVNVGGEVDTTITVTIPDTETRAGGTNSAKSVFENGILDANNVTMRYILQVFQGVKANGTTTWKASKETKFEYSDERETITFDVRLVPGRDYKFVVWADVVTSGDSDTDNHYNTHNGENGVTDLTNVTLKDTWVAMDESRDAFTGVELVEDYSGSSTINFQLTRPFAKLRIVTTDVEALTNLGIEPHNAVVTYTTPYYNSFNALTEEYTEGNSNKTHTYEIASYDDNDKDNMVLYTDYLFVKNDVVKFSLTVNENGGKLIKHNDFTTDIPVQRNYLTTIQGNVLTDGNNVKVVVDPIFENGSTWNPTEDEYDVEIWDGETLSVPEYDATAVKYTVSTASEFVWLTHHLNGTLPETRGNEAYAKKDFTLTLDRDLDFGNNPFIPVNNISGLTFDGNNHTIKNMYVAMGKSYASMFEIASNVTIENLKFDTVYAYATSTGRGATLVGYLTGGTVENVHVKNVEVRGYQKLAGLIAYITQDGGVDVTVKGCSVENVTIGASDLGEVYQAGGLVGYISSPSSATLTIENCEVKGNIAINDTPELEDPASFNYYSGGFIGSIGSNKDANKVITIKLNNCKVGEVTAEPALSVSPRS